MAPVSVTARACDWFDWEGVNGYSGGKKPMEQDWFDNTASDSPLVVAFTLPAGTTVVNPRFEFAIKAINEDAYNDGIGLLFDDSISKRWGWWWGGGGWGDDDEDETKVCKIQHFKEFRTFSGASNFGKWSGSKANITWTLGESTVYGSNQKLVDKINTLGSFNVLLGDDTSVDYIRFIYEVGSSETMNVTVYSCQAYQTANSLSVNKTIYSDVTTIKVSALTDSALYPFSYATYLRTNTRDAKSLSSCFQHRIESSTRYWLFVPSALNLQWVTDGKWTPLESGAGITSTDGVRYKVYTKRYEGGRWVVFGPSAETSTQNYPMYFIATAPSAAAAVAPANPAANCLCSSTGDPHYVTFDSRKYDFYQPGIYHLVKSRDCSFNVQTLTFKYGSTVTVNGIVGIRYLNDTVVMARTKGANGALWTGHPRVYANGVQTTSSKTVGGMVVTKKSDAEWSVSIAAVNFTLRAAEGGSWFHIYASLGDPAYQRTVDGLCGNCDSKGSNDFKYPNCLTAITQTDSSLSASVVAQWGLSWAVSGAESFTAYENLQSSQGVASYAACKATPLQPICPDLILTQVGDGVEPVPPANFYTCDGSTVVPTADIPIPEKPNVTDTDPCDGVDETTKTKYLNRCKECFDLTKYDVESCYTDFCFLPDTFDSFQCPIPNDEPCPKGVVNSTAIWAGFMWATLGDGTGGLPGGSKNYNACVGPYVIPDGWEIAPEGDLSETVAVNNKWEASCVVVATGLSYPTALYSLEQNPCFSANLVKRGECVVTNKCGSRILIRKPQINVCGDGIKNETEACDDGNLVNGDGCDATCKVESGWVCSNTEPTSECFNTGPPVDVTGEEPTFTCPMPAEYCSPCPYSANLATAKTCCVCNTPCCE